MSRKTGNTALMLAGVAALAAAAYLLRSKFAAVARPAPVAVGAYAWPSYTYTPAYYAGYGETST